MQPNLPVKVRSGMTTSRYLRACLRSVFLVLALAPAAACSSDVGGKAETYLLPEGYVGAFYVIYGVPAGEPSAADHDGARLFRIPGGGVLLTQGDPSAGRIDWDQVRFFYEAADGSRTEVKNRWTTSVRDTPASRSDRTLWVFGPSTGTYQKTPDDCPIKHASFQIGRKSDVLDGVGYFDLEGERGLGQFEESNFGNVCE